MIYCEKMMKNVIVNLDKGSAVVIRDVTDYREKSGILLDNKDHYCHLSNIELQRTMKQSYRKV